jgi:hypothetical protein
MMPLWLWLWLGRISALNVGLAGMPSYNLPLILDIYRSSQFLKKSLPI